MTRQENLTTKGGHICFAASRKQEFKLRAVKFYHSFIIASYKAAVRLYLISKNLTLSHTNSELQLTSHNEIQVVIMWLGMRLS